MSIVNSAPPATTSATSPEARLELETSRARQTSRPEIPFRDLLAGGVNLLMSGAEVATHVVAGPILAATVHDARAGAAAALTRSGPAPLAAAPSTGQPGPAAVNTMLQEGQLSNAELLILQQQIQQENQRFSTLSNVMRAKHDTAKAAVSNIRA
jgi:hypothetical protein